MDQPVIKTIAEFQRLCEQIAITYVVASTCYTPEDYAAAEASKKFQEALDRLLEYFFSRPVLFYLGLSKDMRPFYHVINHRKIYLISPELSGNPGLKNLAFIEEKDGSRKVECLSKNSLEGEKSLLQNQIKFIDNLLDKLV